MAGKKTTLYSTTDELLQGYALSRKGDKNALKAKEYVYLRGKKLASGNVSLFIDVCRNGRRVKRYLGLYLNAETSAAVKKQNEETFRIAKTVALEKNAALQKDENGFALLKKAKTQLIPYIMFVADESLKRSDNIHGSYYTLHALANHLKIYSGDKTTLEQVDKAYIRGFVEYLKTAKNSKYKCAGKVDKGRAFIISKNTAHEYYARFKSVIKRAIMDDIIIYNAFDKIENRDKPKTEDCNREFLTIDELKKLIATDFKYTVIKRAFLFCCLVGLRFSDVSSIAWNNFEKGNNGDTLLRVKIKKTRRQEILPVSDEALKMLPDRGDADDEDVIFTLPVNYRVNKLLKKWVASAGIKKHITFHCSRHTAATLNLSLGTPIETVSKLLGHTKISTTQIYAKIIDENKKKAVDRQNGIFD
jgi:integrase